MSKPYLVCHLVIMLALSLSLFHHNTANIKDWVSITFFAQWALNITERVHTWIIMHWTCWNEVSFIRLYILNLIMVHCSMEMVKLKKYEILYNIDKITHLTAFMGTILVKGYCLTILPFTLYNNCWFQCSFWSNLASKNHLSSWAAQILKNSKCVILTLDYILLCVIESL